MTEQKSGLVFYAPESKWQGASVARDALDKLLTPERILALTRVSGTTAVIGSGVTQMMTEGLGWRFAAGLAGLTGNITSILFGGKKTKTPWASLEEQLWEKEESHYVYRLKNLNGGHLYDSMKGLYHRLGLEDKGLTIEKTHDPEAGDFIITRVPEESFTAYQETMKKALETHLKALELIDSFRSKNDKALDKNFSGDVHRFMKANRWRHGHASLLEKSSDALAGDSFRRRVYVGSNGKKSGIAQHDLEVIEETCRILKEVYGLDISVQLKYRSNKAGGRNGAGKPRETEKTLWEPGCLSSLHGIIPSNTKDNSRNAYVKLEFRRSDALQLDQILRDVGQHHHELRLFSEDKSGNYKRLNRTSLQRASNPVDNPSDFSIQTGNASRVLRIISGLMEGRPYEAGSKAFSIAMSFLEGLRGHEFTVLSPQDDPSYVVDAGFLAKYLLSPCKKMGHGTLQWVHANPRSTYLMTALVALGMDTTDAIQNSDNFLKVGLGLRLFEVGVTMMRNPNNTGRGKV